MPLFWVFLPSFPELTNREFPERKEGTLFSIAGNLPDPHTWLAGPIWLGSCTVAEALAAELTCDAEEIVATKNRAGLVGIMRSLIEASEPGRRAGVLTAVLPD